MIEYERNRISQFIQRVGSLETVITVTPSETLRFESGVVSAVLWDRLVLEHALSITLPLELELIWENVSQIYLFEEQNYGQNGFRTISPDNIVQANQVDLAVWAEYLSPCDLIVGGFKNVIEYLVMCCDPSADNFGKVTFMDPMYSHEEWPVVGDSLIDFCEKYIESPYSAFW